MKTTGIIVRGWVAGLLAAGATAGLLAADPEEFDTKTIQESVVLAPSRYTLSVAPKFTTEMAKRLETAVGGLPGITDVMANPVDDTLHFSVREGSPIRVVDIQQAIRRTYNGAATSTPVLEGSQTPHLGL